MHFTLSLLVSASFAAAAPSRPIAPPQQQSTSFQLVANVTGTDLNPSINNYVLSSYHVGAGLAAAVLVPNDSANAGRLFYVNGTAEEVRYASSNVLSSGGTPPFPFGIQIPPPPATTVSINAGSGTAGVGLERFPSPLTYLITHSSTTFIACADSTLPYGPAIVLNVRRDDAPLESGCAELNLLPQCAEDGETHEFENLVGCYADVAGIEWGLYGYGS